MKLKMSSIDGKESLNMNNVLLVDEIPVEHFSIDDINKYAHLKDLNLSTSNQVDVLIGQDQPSALVPIKIRRGPVGTPFATLTIMGWSLNGTSSTNVPGRRVTTNFIYTSVLDEKINKLWEMEEEGIIQESLELSVDDKKVIELWDTQCEIVDDHFQLPIPWKDPDVIMPDNLNVALHRLQSLRASLGKKSMLQDYDQQINHMVAQGYAEHISGDYNERPKKCWYLPTHAVLKKDKCSLRIVFDCAHIYKGISLNGSCYQGPNLTAKIFDVLLRFRQYSHAVMGDIKSMYNQIRIPVYDRDALRFLWVRNDQIIHFRSTSHLFGGVWCASSSSYALKKTAENTHDQDIKNMIQQSFYVDDLAHSSDDMKQLSNQVTQLQQVLNTRGFHLTKLSATDNKILSGINTTDCKITDPSDKLRTALGIGWRTDDDVLLIKVDVKAANSKSDMLSSLASIYDPLGLIAPLLVQGKLLLQEAVRLKIPWNDTLTPVLRQKWENWVINLKSVSKLTIPRSLIKPNFADASFELHCFNDASQQAYGSCIYIRCTSKSGHIHTALVASKVRVCPLKVQTIPRLELQSAVLSARLEKSVKSALTIPLLQSTYWTDSKITLAYIQNETRRFSVFVSKSCPNDQEVYTFRRLEP